MKRRDLERKLRERGWTLVRHGGRHDVWSNADGTKSECLPRHAEINEHLAQAILKRTET
ncbi:MAG: type II toxin-antitoxin system HicA family toxin [Thermoanaerobaculia bacterium]|nr:type II toxin-antitoxin system HicA family toxin [Thermoanaerobaculia bacterium]